MNEAARKAFELKVTIPKSVVYNETKDAYCWSVYPNIIHPEFNTMYECFNLGLEHQQKRVDELEHALKEIVECWDSPLYARVMLPKIAKARSILCHKKQ